MSNCQKSGKVHPDKSTFISCNPSNAPSPTPLPSESAPTMPVAPGIIIGIVLSLPVVIGVLPGGTIFDIGVAGEGIVIEVRSEDAKLFSGSFCKASTRKQSDVTRSRAFRPRERRSSGVELVIEAIEVAG